MRYSWKLHNDFKLKNKWKLAKIGCFVGLSISRFYGLVIGIHLLYPPLFFILPTKIYVPLIVIQCLLLIGGIYAYIMEKLQYSPPQERSLTKLVGDFVKGGLK